MKKNQVINFVFNVFTPLILGAIVGFLTKNDYSYLESLNRTIIIPPIVFPIVWSILYLLQGIWYHLFLKIEPDNDKIESIYWGSIAVNLLFTPLLFTFQFPVFAFIDVIILVLLIGYLFFYSLSKKYKIAYLYVPYMLWLMLATALMFDILLHN